MSTLYSAVCGFQAWICEYQWQMLGVIYPRQAVTLLQIDLVLPIAVSLKITNSIILYFKD